MSIIDKLAAITTRHRANKRRPWWKRSIGALKAALHSRYPNRHPRHCQSVKYGTAAKNTHPNQWNIRGRKNVRQDSRFAKLVAFKRQYGIQ